MLRRDRASDAALLRASERDAKAFAVVYDRYERALVHYFGVRTRDPELTADLTAEVFATLLEHAREFDPSRAAGTNAAPWVFAIARNTLLQSLRHGRVSADARRRVGMTERLSLEDDGYARVEAVASTPSELDALVASLPAEQRAALLARVVDERDYSEIAAELQCSELLVRKRVSRALATLRSVVTKEVDA